MRWAPQKPVFMDWIYRVEESVGKRYRHKKIFCDGKMGWREKKL